MNRPLRPLLVAVATLSLLASTARAEDEWGSLPYTEKGITINPKAVRLSSKGKLWFKLQFINQTELPLVVDPDGLQVKLPDGRLVARSKGLFDKVGSAHSTQTIAPGISGEINAEYMVGKPAKANLVLAGCSLGGKPARLPDYVVKPAGGDLVAKEYNHKGLRINVLSASPSGENISIKLSFLNDTDKLLFVNRDQIPLQLPDGSTIERSKGLFDKKTPIQIGPHLAAEVSFDYKKIGKPAKVELVLAGIYQNSDHPTLPNLVIEAR